MKQCKIYFHVLIWAVELACRISAGTLIFWMMFGSLLAVLPAVALYYNRSAVSVMVYFLTTGQGSFSDIVPSIVVLGIVLILSGLANRVNGDYLYMVMYDKYYFGIEEYFMDCIQRVDVKTLMDKEFYSDYDYARSREGALTDLISYGSMAVLKSISSISLIVVAFTASFSIGMLAAFVFLLVILLNIRFPSKAAVVDKPKYWAIIGPLNYYSNQMKQTDVAKEMRIYHTQEKLMKVWKQSAEKVLQYDKTVDKSRLTYSMLLSACIYLGTVIILLFSIFEVAKGRLKVDVFLMLYLLGENLSETNRMFTSNLLEAIRGLRDLRWQYRFITRVPMRDDDRQLNQTAIAEALAEQSVKSDVLIEGKNLRFSYDGKIEVLHGLNFKIHKGETIALVGANGSGKSTLVKLIADLYHPDSGELIFYGKRYQEYPEGSINHAIGMFFQDFYLFHLTLRENVGFGNLKNLKEDSHILAALQRGSALTVLKKAKNGLEQLLKRDVVQSGMELSGGEQQRIAISRTHMSEKDFLIFDEPAAALDPIAEMEQFRNIKSKTAGKTAILISHRIGFARMADRIFVLENGNLVEVGTHEELLGKNGVYVDFFRQQAQWYEEVGE